MLRLPHLQQRRLLASLSLPRQGLPTASLCPASPSLNVLLPYPVASKSSATAAAPAAAPPRGRQPQQQGGSSAAQQGSSSGHSRRPSNAAGSLSAPGYVADLAESALDPLRSWPNELDSKRPSLSSMEIEITGIAKKAVRKQASPEALRKSLELWSLYQRSNYPLSSIMVGAMISIYTELRCVMLAVKLYQAYPQLGHAWKRLTLFSVLEAATWVGDVNTYLDALQRLEALGQPLHRRNLEWLFNLCVRGGDMGRAAAVLRQMQAFPGQINPRMIRTLLLVNIADKDTVRAAEVLEQYALTLLHSGAIKLPGSGRVQELLRAHAAATAQSGVEEEALEGQGQGYLGGLSHNDAAAVASAAARSGSAVAAEASLPSVGPSLSSEGAGLDQLDLDSIPASLSLDEGAGSSSDGGEGGAAGAASSQNASTSFPSSSSAPSSSSSRDFLFMLEDADRALQCLRSCGDMESCLKLLRALHGCGQHAPAEESSLLLQSAGRLGHAALAEAAVAECLYHDPRCFSAGHPAAEGNWNAVISAYARAGDLLGALRSVQLMHHFSEGGAAAGSASGKEGKSAAAAVSKRGASPSLPTPAASSPSAAVLRSLLEVEEGSDSASAAAVAISLSSDTSADAAAAGRSASTSAADAEEHPLFYDPVSEAARTGPIKLSEPTLAAVRGSISSAIMTVNIQQRQHARKAKASAAHAAAEAAAAAAAAGSSGGAGGLDRSRMMVAGGMGGGDGSIYSSEHDLFSGSSSYSSSAAGGGAGAGDGRESMRGDGFRAGEAFDQEGLTDGGAAAAAAAAGSGTGGEMEALQALLRGSAPSARSAAGAGAETEAGDVLEEADDMVQGAAVSPAAAAVSLLDEDGSDAAEAALNVGVSGGDSSSSSPHLPHRLQSHGPQQGSLQRSQDLLSSLMTGSGDQLLSLMAGSQKSKPISLYTALASASLHGLPFVLLAQARAARDAQELGQEWGRVLQVCVYAQGESWLAEKVLKPAASALASMAIDPALEEEEEEEEAGGAHAGPFIAGAHEDAVRAHLLRKVGVAPANDTLASSSGRIAAAAAAAGGSLSMTLSDLLLQRHGGTLIDLHIAEDGNDYSQLLQTCAQGRFLQSSSAAADTGAGGGGPAGSQRQQGLLQLLQQLVQNTGLHFSEESLTLQLLQKQGQQQQEQAARSSSSSATRSSGRRSRGGSSGSNASSSSSSDTQAFSSPAATLLAAILKEPEGAHSFHSSPASSAAAAAASSAPSTVICEPLLAATLQACAATSYHSSQVDRFWAAIRSTYPGLLTHQLYSSYLQQFLVPPLLNPSRAHAVVREMVEAGLPLTGTVLSQLVVLWCRAGKLDKALALARICNSGAAVGGAAVGAGKAGGAASAAAGKKGAAAVADGQSSQQQQQQQLLEIEAYRCLMSAISREICRDRGDRRGSSAFSSSSSSSPNSSFSSARDASGSSSDGGSNSDGSDDMQSVSHASSGSGASSSSLSKEDKIEVLKELGGYLTAQHGSIPPAISGYVLRQTGMQLLPN